VYDFDKDEVSLGINTHSKGKVQMYSPGQRKNVTESAGHIDTLQSYAQQLGKYSDFDFDEFMKATFR